MDVFLSDSDWESSSESGSSVGQEEIDLLFGGQATTILSSLEESIEKIDDFLSFERGFAYGEIVCSVTNPSGQTGRVFNINVYVDLENNYQNVIKNVDSKKILKIRSISVGDYVTLGTWLGRVDKVVDRVTVVFDDGSKCEVTAEDQEKLVPVSENVLEDSPYQYYPGQRVQVKLSKMSKSVRWLCGAWRKNQMEGTVSVVDSGVVYVDWIASALMEYGSNVTAPPCIQDSECLTVLSCFSHANWQLGDWCMLPASDDGSIQKSTFLDASGCADGKLDVGFKRSSGFSLAEIFVIVKTKSKVDVLWQDGSCSLGLDSQTLIPITEATSHDFWPEQLVLEKGICDDPSIVSGPRWGVVRRVDSTERTVTVQWKMKNTNEVANDSGDQMEETLSAYELVEHPDYSFCYGDVVFRLLQKPAEETAVDREATFTSKNGDSSDCLDTSYASCIGTAMGFKDGAVEVKWASGITTKVAPNEIYGINRYEGSATAPILHEENVEELNQETGNKQNSGQKDRDLLSVDAAGENCKRCPWESSSFYLPQAAVGFFTSIANSLFGSISSTSPSTSVSSCCMSEDAKESDVLLAKEECETHDFCTELQPGEFQEFGNKIFDLEVEEKQERDLSFSKGCEKLYQYKQFDMVNDCSDHHFVGSSSGLALAQVKKAWAKKVQQEWSILAANLPDSIYVRTFEERMDLLRAAIIGPSGTPYHDGLFFFDILLPPQYPHEPPSVHYHSGGLRLNPNLYESGKVCLSLLNTWTGSGTEVWNPESSTILQVLLSLQALVLNEKPYFNEAGYDKQIGRAEGEKNSLSYNENAFLVTCQSMLYQLRKPPKHFEALVEEHFRKRAQHILSACKIYMEGVQVGHAFEHKETEESWKGCSTGFKIMLAKLFPKLVEAFSGKGIDCSQFTESVK